MSGKPRMSGARAALAYFHVPDDDGRRLTLYADRKQAMVVRLIQAGDFTAYPDALRFIIAVKDAGIKVAAASSKNAGLFLRQIRLDSFAQEHAIVSALLRPGLALLEFFHADVSGRDFAHEKPHPEMFLTRAQHNGTTLAGLRCGVPGRRGHAAIRRHRPGRFPGGGEGCMQSLCARLGFLAG